MQTGTISSNINPMPSVHWNNSLMKTQQDLCRFDFVFNRVWVALRSAHHWARGLLRPPTASSLKGRSTSVLWVSTGTHPCGPRGTRAPALRALDEYALRFRGNKKYGLIPPATLLDLFVVTIWSTSVTSTSIHLFTRELLTRARHHVA